jgi:hypothetical protein
MTVSARKTAKKLTVKAVLAEKPPSTQNHSCCVSAQMKRLPITIRVLSVGKTVDRMTTPRVRLGSGVGRRLRSNVAPMEVRNASMSNPAVYKLYKDTDDGRTSRSISVSEDPNGKFALIVTDSYANTATTSAVGDISKGRQSERPEVIPDVDTANQRAKEIHEENVQDGFVDGE